MLHLQAVNLPISKLHSILSLANLLVHNIINQICYCDRISLQSTAINPFPSSVRIWHRLAKLSILILEGIIKKIPISVATMSR